MDISETLLALQARAPWTIARKMIVTAKLSASMGWERTLSKYEGEDVDDDLVEALQAGLIQHILACEKSIKLFQAEDGAVDQLRQSVRALPIPPSPMADAFPLLVDTSLADLAEPRLVQIYDDDDGIFAVYSCVRQYDIRVPLDVTQFQPGVRTALSNYKSIIGIETVRKQVFNCLWIPPSGNVVASLVDTPKEMPQELVERGHTAVAHQLRMGLGAAVPPVNLFPAIDKIYHSKWGRVVEVAFLTDSGSVKNERMRLIGDDLRTEPFHVGGRTAVMDALTIYQMAVQWDTGDLEGLSWTPELKFHGTSRILHEIPPKLFEATLTSSLEIADLRLVLNKLRLALGI